MSNSPTPEERKAADAAAKAREDEEQGKLPYKWTQRIEDLDITASVPSNLKGKDMDVKLTKTSIKAGIKGQPSIIEVSLVFFDVIATSTNLSPGRLSTSNTSRRVSMDARNDLIRQRALDPPRQDE